MNGGSISGAGILEIDGSDFDVLNGTVNPQTINITSGALSVNAGATFTPTNLNINGGTLSGTGTINSTVNIANNASHLRDYRKHIAENNIQ